MHALRRVETGGRVDNPGVHDKPGTYRPEGNHPAVARNAPLAWAEALTPDEVACAGVEAVNVAIIAPEKQASIRQHGGVAHRAVRHERPLRPAGPGAETANGVVPA